ncbi:MAG: Mur ligase domain-containing protein, partial [Candidatus Omnitrophica bacterium]|nr:Mur ligase domain-containing protein [Candidatus Omnitrophota bacterium]
MRYYHLIGIGGIGMSAIARLLFRQGKIVTGSDIKESKITQELRDEGIEVFIGHSPHNLKENTEIVVYSSAIKEDNPEIKEARRRNLIILKRAQILAELMKESRVITIAGSHGKTTTTSLASYLLSKSGLAPTVAIGG